MLWDFLGGLSCYCLVVFWGFFLMKSSTASQDWKQSCVQVQVMLTERSEEMELNHEGIKTLH